jgi:hypothetical protein
MPTLVVQMGHCYRKTGATGTTGEQVFATAAANECVRLLSGRDGWTVRKILADAPSADYQGDAFVAIHCDGSTSTTAHGASVGYRTPEGQTLGQAWKRAYDARGWDGFRVDNYTEALAKYYGTSTAVAQGNRRAIIVESGFLTNPEDRAVLHAADGPTRVALAIGDALGIRTEPQEDDNMPTAQEIAAAVWDHHLISLDNGRPFPAAAYLTTNNRNVWRLHRALLTEGGDPKPVMTDQDPAVLTEAMRPLVPQIADDILAGMPPEIAADVATEVLRRVCAAATPPPA